MTLEIYYLLKHLSAPTACNGTSPCDEAVLTATCRAWSAWSDWHLPVSSALCAYIHIGTRLYAFQRRLGLPDWCSLVQPPRYTLQHYVCAFLHAFSVLACLLIALDAVTAIPASLAKAVSFSAQKPEKAAAYRKLRFDVKWLLGSLLVLMACNVMFNYILDYLRSLNCGPLCY